ncbi:MAG: type I secretion system protein LssZ [Legionella sp.]|uniref:type I secretion system protein LssZ n=1 Tax=Legionella sp. TaxID=459 RepID=UPI0039E303FA
MYTLAKIIQYFFPFIALVLLIIGEQRRAIHYIVSSLWLSLIALLIHFQFSGNQIFSTYFDYMNASIYSFTLFILLLALIRIITHLCMSSSSFKYLGSFLNAFFMVGALLVITNLWINAFFIEHKKERTPIIQVALFDKPSYCHYKYVFYKVIPDNSVMYLCPNYYGLIASIGRLEDSPDFIMSRFNLSAKKTSARPIK